MRARLVTAAAAVAVVGIVSAAARAGPPKLGAPCTTVGQTVTLPTGQKLTCVSNASGTNTRWIPAGEAPQQGGSGGGSGGSHHGGKGKGPKHHGGGSNHGGGGSNHGGGGSSGGSGSSGGGSSSGAQAQPPVLERLPVSIGTYDAGSATDGDFLFTHDQSPAKGPISEFADQISTGSGTKPTSEIGFDWLKPGTAVDSASAGVLTKANYQSDTGDYELWVQPVQGSEYTVIYDHVEKPAVAEGSTVSPGTQLGIAHQAPGSDIAFVELQIVQRVNDQNTQWCPTHFLDPSVESTVAAQMTSLESAWETYLGNASIYDASKDVAPGCLELSYVGG